MRKKLLFILLALTVGLSLTGCNKQDEATDTPTDESTEFVPAVETTVSGMSYEVGTIIGVSEICNTDPSKEVSETCFLDSLGGVSNTLTVEGEGTNTVQVYVKYTDGSEWLGDFTYSVSTAEAPTETVAPTEIPVEEPKYEVSENLKSLLESDVVWNQTAIQTVSANNMAVDSKYVLSTTENIVSPGIAYIVPVDNALGYGVTSESVVWSYGLLTANKEKELAEQGLSPLKPTGSVEWMKTFLKAALEYDVKSFREEYPEDTEDVKIVSFTLGDGSTFERMIENVDEGVKKTTQIVPTSEQKLALTSLKDKLIRVLDTVEVTEMATDLVLHTTDEITYPVKKVCIKENLQSITGYMNIVPVYYYAELDNGDYLIFSLIDCPEMMAEEADDEEESVSRSDAEVVISRRVNGYTEVATEEDEIAVSDNIDIAEVEEWLEYYKVEDVNDNIFTALGEEDSLGAIYASGKYTVNKLPSKVYETVEDFKELIKDSDSSFNMADGGFFSLLYSTSYLNGTVDSYASKLFSNSFVGTLEDMKNAVFGEPEPEVTPTPVPAEPTPEVTLMPSVTPTPTPYIPMTYEELHPEVYRWPERDIVYRRFIFALQDFGSINGTLHSQDVDPGMDYYIDRWVPTPTPVYDRDGVKWYPFTDENNNTHEPVRTEDGSVTYPTFGGVPTPTPKPSYTPSDRPTVRPVATATPRPTQSGKPNPTDKPKATSTPTPTPFIYVNKNDKTEENEDKEPTPKPTKKPTPTPTEKPKQEQGGSTPKNTPTPTPFIFVNKNEDKEYWSPEVDYGGSTGTNEVLSLTLKTSEGSYTVSNTNYTSCKLDKANSTGDKVYAVYNGNRYIITVESKATVDSWTSTCNMSTASFKDNKYTIGTSGSVIVGGRTGSIYLIAYTSTNGQDCRDGYLITARNNNEYLCIRPVAPVPADDLTIVSKLVTIER